MEPLPIPCPAGLVPDVTDADAFNAVYRAAQDQGKVFIAVEHHGPRWMVKADMLTAPRHTLEDAAYSAVRQAVTELIHTQEIRSDSSAGPVYFVLHGVNTEPRARELAAALHAALYGDPSPLTHAASHPT